MAINDGDGDIFRQKVKVRNKLGLHARPAAMLVQALSNFPNDVSVSKGAKKVNAKSIMGVMMLAAGPQSTLMFEIEGGNPESVWSVIEDLFNRNFDEE